MYATAFKVLEILEKSDKPVPSSDISTELSISSSAVWKHINELRIIGYDIVASDDEGYMLDKSNMDFRPHGVYKHLKTKIIGRRMRYFDSIPSTIWYGKDLADQGELDDLHGLVIIAEETDRGLRPDGAGPGSHQVGESGSPSC